MTAGTKIFLAIVGLFVIVLVIYYGFLLPDGPPRVVYGEREDDSGQMDRTDRTERAAGRRSDEHQPLQQPTRTQRQPRTERQQPTERTPASEPVEESLRQPSPGFWPGALDEPTLTLIERDDQEPARAEPRQPSAVEHTADNEGEEPPGEVRPLAETTPAPPRTDAAAAVQPGAQPGDSRQAAGDTDSATAAEKADEPPAARDPVRPVVRVRRPVYTTYTVKEGDTLSTIAQDWFGTASKWDLIAQANPRVDPVRLRIGQELRLPPKDAEREDTGPAAADRQTMYTVRPGDTLSRIAQMYYNDSSRWNLIFEANRDALRNGPDRLIVGMQLRIPPAPPVRAQAES